MSFVERPGIGRRYQESAIRVRRILHPLSEGCLGCGCLSLIAGLGLAAVGTAFAVSATVRIPFTEANITGSGAIGNKYRIENAQTDYAQVTERKTDILSHTGNLTFWLFDGVEKFRIGQEPNAPPFNLDINLSSR